MSAACSESLEASGDDLSVVRRIHDPVGGSPKRGSATQEQDVTGRNAFKYTTATINTSNDDDDDDDDDCGDDDCDGDDGDDDCDGDDGGVLTRNVV